MPLNKQSLFDFLEEVAKELDRPVVLVAAGGTALTLLDVKESTVDVDFTGPRESILAFRAAMESVPHGFKVDLWNDGQVFSQFLPEDYLERSREARTVGRIQLRTLDPLDIVLTKAGRLDERDMEDIGDCIRKFPLKRRDIAKRAAQVAFVGREENYRHNVRVVLDRFFGD
jgi:hypothetical protein